MHSTLLKFNARELKNTIHTSYIGQPPFRQLKRLTTKLFTYDIQYTILALLT